MKSYTDTSWLCSLYAIDSNSQRVAATMMRLPLPLPITWIHRLEFRNSLRLRVFRKEISAVQRDASINALLADIAAGILSAVDPESDRLSAEAERLSSLHTEKIGSRSLDILHVASALIFGMEELLTFDKRQAALARSAGLKVRPT